MDKRWEIVKRSHLCFNCLGKGHTLPTCARKRTCRECSAKHHSLLHQPKPPLQEAAVLHARNGGRALTLWHNSTCKCFGWNHATESANIPGSWFFISSKLAKSLQAKLIKSSITISEMFAGTTVKHQVNVTLSSIHPCMRTVHKTSAYVVLQRHPREMFARYRTCLS